MLAATTPNLEILQFLIDSEPELTRQTLFYKQDKNGNDLLLLLRFYILIILD